jgi:hypothetical protein
MAKTRILICPYCGDTQPHAPRCRACGGHLDPLSRRATHNAMGPWFLRDPKRPYQPGLSYETVIQLISQDRITRNSIMRGPTTRQFWNVAKRIPGVAHLFGCCHACDGVVAPDDHACPHCGERFGAYLDRNHMGLPEVRPLPDEAPGDEHLDDAPARPEHQAPAANGDHVNAGDHQSAPREAGGEHSEPGEGISVLPSPPGRGAGGEGPPAEPDPDERTRFSAFATNKELFGEDEKT